MKQQCNQACRLRRGAALVVALLTLMVVMLITGAILQTILANRRQSLLQENKLQAISIAEAAVQRAVIHLQQDPSYSGETWTMLLDPGTGESTEALAEIRVATATTDPPGKKKITVTASFPRDSARRATAERTFELRLSADSEGA